MNIELKLGKKALFSHEDILTGLANNTFLVPIFFDDHLTHALFYTSFGNFYHDAQHMTDMLALYDHKININYNYFTEKQIIHNIKIITGCAKVLKELSAFLDKDYQPAFMYITSTLLRDFYPHADLKYLNEIVLLEKKDLSASFARIKILITKFFEDEKDKTFKKIYINIKKLLEKNNKENSNYYLKYSDIAYEIIKYFPSMKEEVVLKESLFETKLCQKSFKEKLDNELQELKAYNIVLAFALFDHLINSLLSIIEQNIKHNKTL